MAGFLFIFSIVLFAFLGALKASDSGSKAFHFGKKSALADFKISADFPSLCLFVHVTYKYFKASVYIIQSNFDGLHIMGGDPPADMIPTNETKIFKDYVTMWGEAMPVSMNQVVDEASVNTKPHPDGLFTSSCIAHDTPPFVLIDGFNWPNLMNDWFFQKHNLEEHHQLVKSCPGGDNSLPCNGINACYRSG